MAQSAQPGTTRYHPSLHAPRAQAPRTVWGKMAVVFEMVKFRHSIFALPFALSAMLVAAGGWPRASVLFWIVVACVAARSMAMSFNRLVDREYDARNPRTRERALPANLVTPAFTRGFVAATALVFVLAAAMLNSLCFYLSFPAIALLLGYSYCKRFTEGAHLVLGAALGLAPLGAWIAVRGSFQGLPVFLALGVLFWTTGFDLIYSCLDVERDRREGLRSIPARVGVGRALRAARWYHVFTVLCLALFVAEMRLGPWSWAAMALVAVLLHAEHRLVRPGDLSRVGPAFFTTNAWVSVVFLLGCALDTML
jgi:4-hydroxybenzoate polyprenyltransferase